MSKPEISINDSIEKSALQLQTIFNFIKTSALAFEGEGTEETSAFCWDVVNISEIGYDFSYSIWKEIQDLPADESEKGEKNELPIASQISALLNNPDLPDELYNSITEGLDKVSDVSKFKSLRKIETSAEHIASVLRDYAECGGGRKR